MSLFAFMDGTMASSFVFRAYRPEYRCYVENCDGEHATYALTQGASAPVFPDYVRATQDADSLADGKVCKSIPITADQCNSSEPLDKTLARPCARKVFDTSVVTTSIVTTYNVTCDEESIIPVIGSLHGVGQVLSGLLVGYIADRWGRSIGLCLSTILALCAGIASIWAPTLFAFAVCRVCANAVLSASTCFVLS